jgi:phosphatidylinositol alpha-1,6-mannosyltransferase
VPAASNSRKILLVTNDLGPRAGGIETFILGLFDFIDGNELAIYTSSEEDPAADLLFDQALAKKYGVIVIRDRAKVLLPTPRVTRDVIATMKRFQSETIWFGATAPLALMAPALRKAGATRITGLTHGHEVWWSRLFPFSLAMRRIGRSVDVLTYLGDFTRQAMVRAVGSHPELTRIAPGISLSHFTPGDKPLELLEKFDLVGKPVIISVGRLVHRKGQDRLVAAMPEILKSIPSAVLVFVGEGPRKPYLDNQIKKLHLEEKIRFVGRVSYADLPKYIRMGDLFAMPSRSRFFGLEVEGLGIVYLEASACGLPVLVGASGGAPDAVLPGVTGVVVDGNDLHEIARKSVELLSDLPRARAMGEAGRRWAESEWSWEMWGKRFAELLLPANS